MFHRRVLTSLYAKALWAHLQDFQWNISPPLQNAALRKNTRLEGYKNWFPEDWHDDTATLSLDYS